MVLGREGGGGSWGGGGKEGGGERGDGRELGETEGGKCLIKGDSTKMEERRSRGRERRRGEEGAE